MGAPRRVWIPPYGAAASGLRLGAVFLAILAAPCAAQPFAPAPGVADLSAARLDAERAHLWRVGAWGAANVAAGAVLLSTTSRAGRPGLHAFALQSAAWGAVNVGIAAVALTRGAPDSLMTLADAVRAENRLGDVLWLNLSLNAGYIAVGATLWIVASRGVPNLAAWRGHGRAVVVQGLALFALDAVVLAGSQARLDALIGGVETVSLVPTTGGVALTLLF